MQSDFKTKVYEVVRNIPAGQVLTYQEVAAKAGRPKAARAVGSLMKNNPDKTIIPCHRVVGSDGKMHGYAFGGEKVKIGILKAEGIEFQGERVKF